MNFTQHALDKLEIYGISPTEILEGSNTAISEFLDVKENSEVQIIEVKQILLVLVINATNKNVITVYRTDQKTIENRRKAKRWI